MGLFSKQDAVVKEIAKKEKEKAKQEQVGQSKPALASGQRLGAWIYQPALAIVIFAALLVASLEFVVIQQAEQQQAQRLTEVVSTGLVRSAKRFIEEREALTEALSSSPLVVDAFGNKEKVANLESTLKVMYKDLESLFLISLDDLGAMRMKHPALTFANVDAVRRVIDGEEIRMDSFLDTDRWLMQSAAAINNPETGGLLGAVLVVQNTSLLKKTLALPSSIAQGTVALKNSTDARAKAIIKLGDGNIEKAQVIAVPGSSWRISFVSDDPNFARVERLLILLCLGAFVVLCVMAVVLVSRSNISRIRDDLMAASQTIKVAISGEGKKSKYIHYAEVKTLTSNLSDLAKQKAKERVHDRLTALSSGKDVPEETASPSAPSDAPLFDDDLLDLDVLGEAEDGLTGFNDEENDSMVQEVEQLELDVPQSIFRAYDIRGVVDETLSEAIVELIGRALASEALAQGQTALCVGYDGRLSSEAYCEAITKGIVSTGLDAIVVGQVPTPVLYFATHHLNTGSGVMITGSHNPSNYNGFKMMLGGNTLAGEDIQKLYNRIILQDFAEGQGARSQQSVDRDYLDTILNDIAVAAPLKVVVDAGNGVAGELGPALIEELGCEVIPLFCEIDGTFPNHHPDPGKPQNLQDLIAAVEEHDADIGIAFDGDGDRVGVVTNTGKIIWPDRLLMLFAKDVVSRNPGADVIFDVKCSRRLNGLISGYGGRPIMWKTGHSLIKAKMKETGALLAGEMSGHVFFKERWFGFDDGLYSAARLLEILGVEDSTSDEVFQAFPEDVSTPEINIEVTDESKFLIVEKLCQLKSSFIDGNASTIDGLRVDYPNGWGLCRASNTTPVLVLRFEADDEDALESIKEKFKAQLSVVEPSLNLEF